MKLLLYILLAIPHVIFSQDLNKIKASDTIYIYFKNDNINQIKNLSNNKLKSYNYIFEFDLKDIKPRQSLELFEDYRTTIPEKKIVKKSFLKKNKNITVDYTFLKKLGFFEAHSLISNKKKIYLIDYRDMCLFKIKLKEVKFNNYNPNPIE